MESWDLLPLTAAQRTPERGHSAPVGLHLLYAGMLILNWSVCLLLPLSFTVCFSPKLFPVMGLFKFREDTSMLIRFGSVCPLLFLDLNPGPYKSVASEVLRIAGSH